MKANRSIIHFLTILLMLAMTFSLLSVGALAAPGGSGSSGGSSRPGGGGSGGSGGGSSSSVIYAGATEITSAATQSDQTYASTTADESALYISTSDEVTINNPTVTKTGSSSGGDNCNFYGQNATVLTKGGGTTTITGGNISSSATGANGVFCYGGNSGKNGAAGDGTTLYISGTTITTTGSGSGGIMTTGGGVTYANDLTITTSGGSSAPIRTDRGGGTVVVDGGTYTSNGLGSPAIYSTADITVKNATLVSNLSEGVCIEGKNSITLENCELTANNTKRNGNAKFCDTIMIYQSMSGDADSGTSSFTMTGGTLTNKYGHVFHVTNTNAIINLSGVEIVNEHTGTYKTLISVCADGWSGGSNIATLNADAQELEGGVLVGSDSTLTMNLENGSTFTGYFSGDITNYAGTTVSTSIGTVKITLDETSKIYLEADAYVTSFKGDPANVITNGYTMYVNGVALEGTTETDADAGSETSGDNTPADDSSETGDDKTDEGQQTEDTGSSDDKTDEGQQAEDPSTGDDSGADEDSAGGQDSTGSDAKSSSLGDVNGDGEIDDFDAALILRAAVGLIEDIDSARADVNGDGEVDDFDAALILRYSVGLIASF